MTRLFPLAGRHGSGLQVQDGLERLVDPGHGLGGDGAAARRAVEAAGVELLDVRGDRGAGDGVADHHGHGGVGVPPAGVQHDGQHHAECGLQPFQGDGQNVAAVGQRPDFAAPHRLSPSPARSSRRPRAASWRAPSSTAARRTARTT
ncbi:hypothetical protein DF17_21375 [Streptomyces rimosus]|nr:hypothetical protein DF17_21375 [Streptomyces rimosus]